MSFHHRDAGTDEDLWRAAIAEHDTPTLDLTMDALFIVAAHPDDEALGVGGLLHRAAARGIPITLLVVTDGENSHPASRTVTSADLGRRRRSELCEAMAALAPDAEVRFLGIPDGRVLENRASLSRVVDAAVETLRAQAARPLVVGPWQGDRHRDHRVVGEAAEQASAAAGLAYLAYPIWLWHWGSPNDVPWQDARAVHLDETDLVAKRTALAAHASQVRPLSDEPGDDVMLHARMLSHFDRPVEMLLAETTATTGETSIAAGWFEGFYARHEDPWGFDSRWYEQRKRAVLLASLPDRRYRRGLELGCGTGALTEGLAARCERLVAVDAAGGAIERARRRLDGEEGVDLRTAVLPEAWPDGRFDLIVVSEIGYYWGLPDLEAAIGRMRESLSVGGALVACHWRHPVADHRRSGDAVHAALRATLGMENTVHHEERDFVLDVFLPAPARSVAEREGLVR